MSLELLDEPSMPTANSINEKQAALAQYDVLIIGGGINGCGIARELAGLGYRVMLAEQNDLASGTSSWSSKLVHGGLRYLEHYQFRLVRESLGEREVLMNMAPHLIRPARFILPHASDMRPRWLLRLGLFCYDWLGKYQPGRRTKTMARLPGSRRVDLDRHDAGAALKTTFSQGFEYSDCVVDDTRLTIVNARAAADLGADIRPYSKAHNIRREKRLWLADIGGETIRARMVINAAGPWADILLRESGKAPNAQNIRLVQGSHLITKKLFDHDHPYIFQTADGRILFAIPYQRDFTLLGTTDRDYDGDPGAAEISVAERDYILAAANRFLDRPVTHDDIISSFSGVRPLFDDGKSEAQTVTRDYVLDLQDDNWLNIFGGKLTTYRKLARQIAELVQRALPAGPDAKRTGGGSGWESAAALPGGDMGSAGFIRWQSAFIQSHKDLLSAEILTRLSYAYGSKAGDILANVTDPTGLGTDFGHGLFGVEVDYLIEREWATSADDILQRRSKLGLLFTAQQRKYLEDYMNKRVTDAT